MSYLEHFPNSKPVLQIIHTSDMHVLAAEHQAQPLIRAVEREAKKISSTLYKVVRKGTAPSDPLTEIFFRSFIDEITNKDKIWSKYPTWIVDTGDHTVFGDSNSLTLAKKYLANFASAGGPSCRAGVIVDRVYGNHDAWPETLPLLAKSKIQKHTNDISKPPFGYFVQKASPPLRVHLPNKGSEIQLYTIDTVNDHFWENTWARGYVGLLPLNKLKGKIRNSQGSPNASHLRILATHHPIKYPPPIPPPIPFRAMVLANARKVGNEISEQMNRIHIVLSGHTHELYPKHGKLLNTPRLIDDDPLGTDQIQLVTGSLMQVDRFGKRGPLTHQCQVLRFYQDPTEPTMVILQRLIAARNPNGKAHPSGRKGPFEFDFIKVPGKDSYEEEIIFYL